MPSLLLSSSSSSSSTFNTTTTSNKSSNVRSVILSIAKVVNPLGTVSTAQTPAICNSYDLEKVQKERLEISDRYIHENCDESLFRPVITVCGEVDIDINETKNNGGVISKNKTNNNVKTITNVSKLISNELIVPVIEEKLNNKLKNNNNQNHNKIADINKKHEIILNESKLDDVDIKNMAKFDELSLINKKSKQQIVVKPSESLNTAPATVSVSTTETTSNSSSNRGSSVVEKVKVEPVANSKSKKNQSVNQLPSSKSIVKNVEIQSEPTVIEPKKIEPIKVEVGKTESDEELKKVKKVEKVEEAAVKKEVKENVKTKGKKNKNDKYIKEKDISTNIKEKVYEKSVRNEKKLPENKVIIEVPPKLVVKEDKHDDDDVVIIESETSFCKLPDFNKDIVDDSLLEVIPQEKSVLLESLMTSSNEAVMIQESLLKNFKPIIHKTFTTKVNDYNKINNDNMIDDIINAYDDVHDDDEDDDVQTLLSKINFKDPEEFFDITTSAKFDVEFLETEPSDIQHHHHHDRDYDLSYNDNFERLSYKDAIEDSGSLINFESPIEENAVGGVGLSDAATKASAKTITSSSSINTPTATTSTLETTSDNSEMQYIQERNQRIKDTYFSDTNLVFAMCSSLKDDFNDRKLSTSSTASSLITQSRLASVDPQEGQDSDYKSLELEIDESYISLEPSTVVTNIESIANVITNDYTSSDDADDSSNDVKHVQIEDDRMTTRKLNVDDDEELRPFIKVDKNKTSTEPSLSTPATTSSSSSSTSSSGSSSANNSAKDILTTPLPDNNNQNNKKTKVSTGTTSATQSQSNNINKKKSKQKRKNF